MMSFRNGRLREFKLPMSARLAFVRYCRVKGRHDLFVKQSPQILKVLRETGPDPERRVLQPHRRRHG